MLSNTNRLIEARYIIVQNTPKFAHQTHVNMPKPRIFIGSSTDGLDVARALQDNLETDNFSEVTIWTQGVFQLSGTIISSLVKALDKFDYAIFVFTPADTVKIKGKENSVVRDNVIYETGLFGGRLGVDHVFFVKPSGTDDFHLPSDLNGVTYGVYDPNRAGNLVAATGRFCSQVRAAIQSILDESKLHVPAVNTFERDLDIIKVYLRDKGFAFMSFSKISESINTKYTEDYLMQIIYEFPERIRRSKLKDGKYGIKLLDEE